MKCDNEVSVGTEQQYLIYYVCLKGRKDGIKIRNDRKEHQRTNVERLG
jgi:hypothetical protein